MILLDCSTLLCYSTYDLKKVGLYSERIQLLRNEDRNSQTFISTSRSLSTTLFSLKKQDPLIIQGLTKSSNDGFISSIENGEIL